MLWLGPIKVQGCGAVGTTIMMLTWLTALMRSLQAGCHVASNTVIIATGVPDSLPSFCGCVDEAPAGLLTMRSRLVIKNLAKSMLKY